MQWCTLFGFFDTVAIDMHISGNAIGNSVRNWSAWSGKKMHKITNFFDEDSWKKGLYLARKTRRMERWTAVLPLLVRALRAFRQRLPAWIYWNSVFELPALQPATRLCSFLHWDQEDLNRVAYNSWFLNRKFKNSHKRGFFLQNWIKYILYL